MSAVVIASSPRLRKSTSRAAFPGLIMFPLCCVCACASYYIRCVITLLNTQHGYRPVVKLNIIRSPGVLDRYEFVQRMCCVDLAISWASQTQEPKASEAEQSRAPGMLITSLFAL